MQWCWAGCEAGQAALTGRRRPLNTAPSSSRPHPTPPHTTAAGNVTPLNNSDKEALKQRLDALDARRLQAAAAGGGGGGGGAKGGAAAAPRRIAHASLTSQWLPALHTAQLNKQKARPSRSGWWRRRHARRRASAALREFLQLRYYGPAAGAGGERGADAALAASASTTLAELATTAAQLAASRDLSPGEAELAVANLAALGEAPPRHVCTATRCRAARGGRRRAATQTWRRRWWRASVPTVPV